MSLTTPPGWYPDPSSGMQRWWDGAQWGQIAPVRAVKESGIAYIFLLLLGSFGAHHFYLRRTGPAVAQLLLWWGGWLTTFLLVGFVALAAVVIWWIVDLIQIPSYVREANMRP